MTEWISS